MAWVAMKQLTFAAFNIQVQKPDPSLLLGCVLSNKSLVIYWLLIIANLLNL